MFLKGDVSAQHRVTSLPFWGHPCYITVARKRSSKRGNLMALFCPGLISSHFAICPWTYELEHYLGGAVKATDPTGKAVCGWVIEEECMNGCCLSSGKQLCGMCCLFIMILDEGLAWLSVNDMKTQIASLETSSKHHDCVITPAGEKNYFLRNNI